MQAKKNLARVREMFLKEKLPSIPKLRFVLIIAFRKTSLQMLDC